MWLPPSYQPQQDSDLVNENSATHIFAFGSAHPGSLNMAFCDGSVQALSYDVDTTVHARAANRLDGESR
jgi:prepilin-type processing-associated H-X9-DG protein